MPELIELIKEYGQLMYDAGVREKEDDHQAVCEKEGLCKKAKELLERIEWLCE